MEETYQKPKNNSIKFGHTKGQEISEANILVLISS